MKNNNAAEKVNVNQLVGKLKVEDRNYAKLSRAIQILYWVMIPMYVIMTVLEWRDTHNIKVLWGGLAYVSAFVIFAVFFGVYYKEYKYVNYALPTIEMLKGAAYRYKPLHAKALWIVLALIFMDIGLVLDETFEGAFWRLQLIFVGTIIVSAGIGLVIWYFKYKPLRDNALRLIAEIENE